MKCLHIFRNTIIEVLYLYISLSLNKNVRKFKEAATLATLLAGKLAVSQAVECRDSKWKISKVELDSIFLISMTLEGPGTVQPLPACRVLHEGEKYGQDLIQACVASSS